MTLILAMISPLHLHDQGAVLVAVLIEGVQLCYRVIKCLVKKPMRMMVRRIVVWLLMKRKQCRELFPCNVCCRTR